MRSDRDLFPRVLLSVALAFAGLGLYLAGTPERELERRERAWGFTIQPGDLVFQDLACGERCALIRRVTASRYAHVGLVDRQGGERVVYEAYDPVGPVRLADWVARGIGGDVAVYRPDEELLAELPRARAGIASMLGRPYDGLYQWDDDAIYCSELVVKAFAHGGAPLFVEPHPISLGALAERIALLSGGRLTERTPMVTPRDLVESPRVHRLVDELEAPSFGAAQIASE